MVKKSTPPINTEVAAVFNAYPGKIKAKLLYLRQLIFDIAASSQNIGKLEETLKWGEPSYLTTQSKSGSTIRIAWKALHKEQYSILFKCTANLVPVFKEKYPDTFRFGGTRSIDFELHDNIPVDELKKCIALALTYHQNKKMPTADRWALAESILKK